MFSKEETTEALRIVSMAAIGAYPDGKAVIEDLKEHIKDEELRKMAAATIAATIEARNIIKLLGTLSAH